MEAEQKQRSKIQEINNRITNEIDKKIEEYGKRQKCMNNWRLWGPSILISVTLTAIAILFLTKSKPTERLEPKEIKIDIKSNSTIGGANEKAVQNEVKYSPMFPRADIYSTTPQAVIPQVSQLEKK